MSTHNLGDKRGLYFFMFQLVPFYGCEEDMSLNVTYTSSWTTTQPLDCKLSEELKQSAMMDYNNTKQNVRESLHQSL